MPEPFTYKDFIMQADFGLIGLAVMGENLALNVESRGYTIAVYNRSTDKVDALLAGRAKGKKFIGCRRPVDRPIAAETRARRHHHRRWQ